VSIKPLNVKELEKTEIWRHEETGNEERKVEGIIGGHM
jgi:hypothetical protein